jgi:hypothetical protein
VCSVVGLRVGCVSELVVRVSVVRGCVCGLVRVGRLCCVGCWFLCSVCGWPVLGGSSCVCVVLGCGVWRGLWLCGCVRWGRGFRLLRVWSGCLGGGRGGRGGGVCGRWGQGWGARGGLGGRAVCGCRGVGGVGVGGRGWGGGVGGGGGGGGRVGRWCLRFLF